MHRIKFILFFYSIFCKCHIVQLIIVKSISSNILTLLFRLRKFPMVIVPWNMCEFLIFRLYCFTIIHIHVIGSHTRTHGSVLLQAVKQQKAMRCNKTDGVFNLHTNLSSDIFDLCISLARPFKPFFCTQAGKDTLKHMEMCFSATIWVY